MTQPPAPPNGPDQPGGYPNAAPQPPADPGGSATPPSASGPPAPPPPGGYAPPAGGYTPPPAGYSAPPPPAGYAGPPSPAARAGFDPSTVAKSDWAFFGIGFLMLIFSFFGWVSGSFTSAGGWNTWWIIIQLLLVASIAVRAVQVFTGKLMKEIPGIAQVGVAAVMVLLYVIALINIFASYSFDASDYCADEGLPEAVCAQLGSSASQGPGFGIWASLILSLGFVYFLALSKQKEGPLPIKVPGPANF